MGPVDAVLSVGREPSSFRRCRARSRPGGTGRCSVPPEPRWRPTGSSWPGSQVRSRSPPAPRTARVSVEWSASRSRRLLLRGHRGDDGPRQYDHCGGAECRVFGDGGELHSACLELDLAGSDHRHHHRSRSCHGAASWTRGGGGVRTGSAPVLRYRPGAGAVAGPANPPGGPR